jgi:hypothetical protein
VVFEKNRIPEIASRRCNDPGGEMIGKILRRSVYPMEKRSPDCLGLLLVQPLKHHPDLEAIAEPQRGDLPPVWIEEIVGIKVDELTDQPAKGGVGEGVDRC